MGGIKSKRRKYFKKRTSKRKAHSKSINRSRGGGGRHKYKREKPIVGEAKRVLLEHFAENPHLTPDQVKHLSEELDIAAWRIRKWFDNNRQKKRQKKTASASQSQNKRRRKTASASQSQQSQQSQKSNSGVYQTTKYDGPRSRSRSRSSEGSRDELAELRAAAKKQRQSPMLHTPPFTLGDEMPSL